MSEAALTRWFNVNGLALTVAAENARLLQAGCSVIEPFEVAEPGADAWRIDLRMRAAELSWVEDRAFVADGIDETGVEWRLHYGPEGSAVWVGGRTAARVDLPGKYAEVRAIAGAEGEVSITAVIVALDDFLAAAGQFMMHAACLRASVDDAAPAVLLFAPSGTGKTTTSLALAREGMPLMSDDGTILSVRAGRVTGWGLPRATKVHQRTAAMLPWLAPALRPFDGPSEQAIELEALRKLVPVARPTPAAVGLIVALQKPNAHGHRLETMSPVRAVEHMALENLRPVDRSAKGVAAQRLAVLAALAGAAPVRSLSVGPDPRGLGNLLRAAVRG